mmetsp:Transcript_13388/g.28300  ORF Transcript_13388/g.28300 Transcript_13388/m.28300 type:complete len:100 (-) Transcript_13388:1351-1650(-)
MLDVAESTRKHWPKTKTTTISTRAHPKPSLNQQGTPIVPHAFFLKFPWFVGKEGVPSGDFHNNIVDPEEESFKGEGYKKDRGVLEGMSHIPEGKTHSEN